MDHDAAAAEGTKAPDEGHLNGEPVIVESAATDLGPGASSSSADVKDRIVDGLHAQPIETLAAGRATNQKAIDDAAQHIKEAPSRGETDDPDLKDLGWEADHRSVHTLAKGLSNEDLWALIRRFHKQTFHLRAVPELPLGGLDMLTADDQQFSSDKLRAELERFYVDIFTGSACFLKHIARLRSWRERKRTIGFLVGYVIAWVFDLVVPAILLLLMVMVAFKPSRAWLFPPMPLALVSAKHGGLQEPTAGVLGSTDSLTGAVEAHRGEAVEHEASHFITGLASVGVSAAMGRTQAEGHSESDEDGSKGDTSYPDPAAAVSGLADARGTAQRSKPQGEVVVSDGPGEAQDGSLLDQGDKTKVPVQTAIWDKATPVMNGIAGVSDMQERFANALSPTPPFSTLPRYRLAACFIPLILGSAIADAHLVSKGLFAGLGFGFFGQPLMDRGWHWLNKTIPDWPKYLEIQNTLLVGVPTNAQLTIALLRIAEAHKAPLPPPPSAAEKPPEEPDHHELAEIAKDNPIASESEIHAAANADSGSAHVAPKEAPKPAKHSKLVGFLRGTAAAAIGTGLTKAHVEAATVGNEHARNKLGALPGKTSKRVDGPTSFRSRFHGHRGKAYITTNAVTASLAFSKGQSPDQDTKPVWSMQIEDIRELKKVHALGWKTTLIVGAVLKRDMAEGLEIVDAEGHTYRLTAIHGRDELFGRLIALGSQKWSMV